MMHEIKKSFLDKVYSSDTNIDLKNLKIETDIFCKEILKNYVPKSKYNKIKNAKENIEQHAKQLKKQNVSLEECQRILRLVGKTK